MNHHVAIFLSIQFFFFSNIKKEISIINNNNNIHIKVAAENSKDDEVER